MSSIFAGTVFLLALSAPVQDFQKRIEDYGKLRQTASSHLPHLKTTDSPDVIAKHEHLLAQAIREARFGAKQGDIFAPEIAAEFRRLIGSALQGHRAARVEKSLQHAEPVALKLRVDDAYPSGIPLQSTPPTLLSSLPKLPKELQYRIAGRDLVLLDVDANLVVDFIPGAIAG